MKRFLPDSLTGRTVLVLVLGLFLSQLAAAGFFVFTHSDLARRISGRQMSERIANSVKVFSETPMEERAALLRNLNDPSFRVQWHSIPFVTASDGDPDTDALRGELSEQLQGRVFLVGARRPPSFDHPPMPEDDRPGGHWDFEGHVPPPDAMGHDPLGRDPRQGPPHFRVSVRLDDGSWLNFSVNLLPQEPLLRPGFLLPLGGSMVVVMLISVFAVRRAARPLGVLAAAAQRLGRDMAAPPVPEDGPREVRAAAAAFNEMQVRLRRFIDDRTQMVAAISHDLRTPITRIKLRAEFIDDDELRGKLLLDLDEMEAMIASTLAFARNDAAKEPRTQVDLAAMLSELCGDFGIPYQGPEALVVVAGALGLKRAFANMLDNARKYGVDARLSLGHDAAGTHAQIVILDDGPGIPEAEIEQVFAPFYRVESSRNRETGGTGLGLATARSVLRAHGGDIQLFNRPEGGLKVLVTLPV